MGAITEGAKMEVTDEVERHLCEINRHKSRDDLDA